MAHQKLLKSIFILLQIILFSLPSFAQDDVAFDKIYKKDKTLIECKILRVTEESIEFDPKGEIPFDIVARNEVDIIIYSDNTVVDLGENLPSAQDNIEESNSASMAIKRSPRGILIDTRDGQTYKTIEIATQTWMAENLAATKFNDGEDIQNIVSDKEWKDCKKTNTSAYCWMENDSAKYGNLFGALYNGYVIETQKICPSGWHVPTLEDWEILFRAIGGRYIGNKQWAGVNNKLRLHFGWKFHQGTNEFGFDAAASSCRSYSGEFRPDNLLEHGYYWTSTPHDKKRFKSIHFHSLQTHHLYLYSDEKPYGFSIRCVLD